MSLISLYPEKTLETQNISYVSRGIEIDQWHEMNDEATQQSIK